jgi:integrase
MTLPNMRPAADHTRAMTRRIAFTRTTLDRLTVPAGKNRVWVFDAKTPNLAFMKTAMGATSFYRYFKQNGRPVRYRLGPGTLPVETARDLCNRIAVETSKGIDVQQARRSIRDDATLGDIWTRWYDEYAKPRLRASTQVKDESLFRTCFSDWMTRRVNAITPADVQRKLNELGISNGHTTANRAVQLLRRLLNFAKVNENPVAKGQVEFFREAPRERYLTGDELAKLLASIDAEPNQTIADFCKLSLWTGQRRGNVCSMRWDELDLDNAVWSISAAKMKAGKSLSVPLVPPAVQVLSRRKDNKSEYVFPGRGGIGHLEEPKSGWKRILKRAKLGDVHIHDLRHNVASWSVQHGASLYATGKLLGHADSVSTQRYSHLALDPLRATITTAVDAMTAAVEAAKAKAAESAK